MATLDLGRTEIIAGARYEHTGSTYAGKRLSFDANGDFTNVQEVETDQSFGSFFPAFHLRYRVDDATNVRFAATRTIARPGFLSVAPNEYIRFDDEIITRGNPDLRPGLSLPTSP